MRRWRFWGQFLRPVFSASFMQHISDCLSKFALRPHHVHACGRSTSNFRPLRIGEEKRKKKIVTTAAKYNAERHQWKPAVQATAVMLRTPPRRRPVTGQPATPTSHIRRAILRTRADPAQRSHYVVISQEGRNLVR